MSIAHHNPGAPVVKVEKHSVTQNPNLFAVKDVEFDPSTSLEANLRGTPWKIKDYYRQILALGDEPKELDINITPPFQHYEKIEGLELLAQGGLTPSTDENTQLSTLIGESVLYSFIRPNVHDYFTADVNHGRLGLFVIQSIQRLTGQVQSAHVIRYAQIAELEPDSPMYLDLERKFLKDSVKVFSRERLIANQNPILLKQRHVDVKKLRGEILTLVSEYWNTFYRYERGTLFVPGQCEYIYDPFLTLFFHRLVDSNMLPEKHRMILLTGDNDPALQIKTLWSALASRRESELRFSTRKFMMANPFCFDHVQIANSAFFSNTDYTVFPEEYDQSAEVHRTKPGTGWGVMNNPTFRYFTVSDGKTKKFAPEETLNAFGERPDPRTYQDDWLGKTYVQYNHVQTANSYIFSQDFYRGSASSILELMVLDYLGHRNLNFDNLKNLLNTYPEMPRLEQFYYGPIIILLLKEAVRGAYA